MGDSGFSEDFDTDVEFSGYFKGILKDVATEQEHWLSQDAVEALNQCLKAFLGDVVVDGAVAASERGKRSVITPAHILEALEAKGFAAVADELREKHGALFAASKKKKKDTGMSEQQMVSQQSHARALRVAARAEILCSRAE